jgi:hypothetical protein
MGLGFASFKRRDSGSCDPEVRESGSRDSEGRDSGSRDPEIHELESRDSLSRLVIMTIFIDWTLIYSVYHNARQEMRV